MPRRDLITFDTHSEYGLNVFDTVGISGANNPGDLMTIQAMFRYLSELWLKPEYTALSSLRERLAIEPDGLIGPKTINAISAFQQYNWYKLLRTDRLIHPAKYENRIILSSGKFMTITLMHEELWMAEDNAKDYTREIATRFPNVAFWIQ